MCMGTALSTLSWSARAELGEPPGTPGEVVRFLGGRIFEVPGRRRVAGHCRLTLIEGLRGNLPGAIDPHQAGALPALPDTERRLVDGLGRRGPGRRRRRGQRSQAPVEDRNQSVAP